MCKGKNVFGFAGLTIMERGFHVAKEHSATMEEYYETTVLKKRR